MLAGGPPTVSAVVPTFNGASFIDRCLGALVAQHSETIEVIVVDDGSTDRTADAVERFSGVRLVRSPHRGVAAARSTGIALASAEFIGFCDQDDEWLPDKAHRQAEYLRSTPGVAAVMSRQLVVLDGVERPSWLVDDANGDPGGVAPLSGLFRAEVFESLGGFVDSPLGNDDFDLLVRMREAGMRIEVLTDTLSRRHIHDRNASHDLGSYAPGMVEVFRRRAQRARR